MLAIIAIVIISVFLFFFMKKKENFTNDAYAIHKKKVIPKKAFNISSNEDN